MSDKTEPSNAKAIRRLLHFLHPSSTTRRRQDHVIQGSNTRNSDLGPTQPPITAATICPEQGLTSRPAFEEGEESGKTWWSLKQKAKTAIRITETLVKLIAPCIDESPAKAVASVIRAVVQVKQAVLENQETLKAIGIQNGERLLAIGDAVAQSPYSARERIVKFGKTLEDQRAELNRLTSSGTAEQIFDYERRQKDIQECFARVDEAMKCLQLEILWSIERMVDGIHDDIKDIRLDRFRCAPGATYDAAPESGAVYGRTFCAEGTRERILGDLKEWAEDNTAPHIFWLTGQAGVGKTTIASTIARIFDETPNLSQPLPSVVLGGNFLCSRLSLESRRRTNIIPTIVYQLARKSRSFAEALNKEDKFDLVNKPDKQMVGLLVNPWRAAQQNKRVIEDLPQYLIVIDALDEVDGDEGPRFLSDLLGAVNQLAGLKFLVTSRPHPEVEAMFGNFNTVCRLQKVPKTDVDSDILKYLVAELPNFKDRTHELQNVMQRADGLFIYAATVVRYLKADKSTSRIYSRQRTLLDKLLDPSSGNSSQNTWTATIDDLYIQILGDFFSNCHEDFLEERRRLLHVFLCTMERISPEVCASLVSLDVDVSPTVEEAKVMLEELHAVLYLEEGRVFWYHQSFLDFVFSERARFTHRGRLFDLGCNSENQHSFLSTASFRVMDSKLCFNIGDISSSFVLDAEDDGLDERVEANIPEELRYCCRYWLDHLAQVGPIDSGRLAGLLSNFLELRILFWIEAMNLLGLVGLCNQMLLTARNWVPKQTLSLINALHEAAMFTLHFGGSPASLSTPNLYLSALATWRADHKLIQKWRSHFPFIPAFNYTRENDPALMVIPTESNVLIAAFSLDGSHIVSGALFGSIQVWGASTGVEKKTLIGRSEKVRCVAVSANGRRIAMAPIDRLVSLYICDTSTGTEIAVPSSNLPSVRAIAFSANGEHVACGTNNSIRLLDAFTGKERHVLKIDGTRCEVVSLAYSPDGNRIVSSLEDDSVRIWDISTGVELLRIKLGDVGNFPIWVAFSPEGNRIVTTSLNISIRDASTGELVNTLHGHSDTILSIAFSPDGRFLVSGSADHSIRLWDALTGTEIGLLNGHSNLVNSVSFSHDGSRIVSSSDDYTIRIWDVTGVINSKVLEGHNGMVFSAVFSPDGNRIISGSTDNTVRVWDTSTFSEVTQFRGHRGLVRSVSVSPNGNHIVSGSEDGTVWVWDVLQKKKIRVILWHRMAVRSVAFSPNSSQSRAVSGSQDMSVRVWDPFTGIGLNKFVGHSERVLSVAFSPDGRYVVSGSDDYSIRLWDTLGEVQTSVFRGHEREVNSVVFSPDGRRLASGSGDKTIRIWNTRTGTCINVLHGHHNTILAVNFSTDGDRIASGSSDTSLRIWSATTGALLKVLRGHSSWVRSVAFSPDGGRIVSSSDDYSIRIWDSSIPADTDYYDASTPSASSSIYDEERATYESLVPLDPVSDDPLAWTIDFNGGPQSFCWVFSVPNRKRLMWVPPDAAHVLLHSSLIHVISRNGYATLNFRDCYLGTEWTRCFVP